MNYCFLFWLTIAFLAGASCMLAAGMYLSRWNIKRPGQG
jgi:hypothetical protein